MGEGEVANGAWGVLQTGWDMVWGQTGEARRTSFPHRRATRHTYVETHALHARLLDLSQAFFFGECRSGAKRVRSAAGVKRRRRVVGRRGSTRAPHLYAGPADGKNLAHPLCIDNFTIARTSEDHLIVRSVFVAVRYECSPRSLAGHWHYSATALGLLRYF
ncbi:unnamed protein product, partial [Iphiclides podalirius]